MKGYKYDTDKDRWDLLPLEPIKYLVKVLTFGAKKYKPNDWQKVKDGKERYYAALHRHLADYRLGEWLDKESNLPHLAHALCCIVFIFWLELKKK